MSTRFSDVILEASKRYQEKEIRYIQVRDARRKVLHEQAEEVDRMMDGRRNRKRRKA